MNLMYLSTDDFKFAVEVTSTLPGSFVVGSTIVNMVEAKDLDIVCTYSVHCEHVNWFMRVFGFPEAHEINPEYDGSSELWGTYRKDRVNVLIVRDEFIDAYRRAIRHMREAPDLFKERWQRVWLHQDLKNEIRSAIGQDEYYLGAIDVQGKDITEWRTRYSTLRQKMSTPTSDSPLPS